ncbi:hypothetical protein EDWATA_00657 [Edwardsiella tarda ATCC 23685]|uniref:Uncharacterized protein n=1 Tax=Edwardsiella tarda ATCC 23685 TaxID=500638 RepID=D4F1R4_EDWTA|nr:hypothetical protein EDWATA_00657 [Edwardsiella tarda ATCC 23685]
MMQNIAPEKCAQMHTINIYAAFSLPINNLIDLKSSIKRQEQGKAGQEKLMRKET